MNKPIKIYDVNIEAFKTVCDQSVIRINWNANIGFGQYDIEITNESDKDGNVITTKIEGNSECMDRGENKGFIKALFDKIIEKMEIVG